MTSLTACSGSGLFASPFGPKCDPAHNPDIGIASQFTLSVGGGPLSDSAGDSSTDGGTLHEYDTCRGIASINFQLDSDGNGNFTITPIAVGQCKMTVDDGQHCATVPVNVVAGSSPNDGIARRV
jgi:hypothetical protein